MKDKMARLRARQQRQQLIEHELLHTRLDHNIRHSGAWKNKPHPDFLVTTAQIIEYYSNASHCYT